MQVHLAAAWGGGGNLPVEVVVMHGLFVESQHERWIVLLHALNDLVEAGPLPCCMLVYGMLGLVVCVFYYVKGTQEEGGWDTGRQPIV